MQTLIIYSETEEQLTAFKVLAKAMKIKVEISHYNPEFVAMVKNAAKKSNYKEIDPKDVWAFCK